MSVKIMAQVFESETLAPTERLILLALADHANDEGHCYPSIARLCQRTGLGERAVQGNLRRLEAAGYLEIERGGGRGNKNLYTVIPAPKRAKNPAQETPYDVHPAPETPFLTTETPHLTTENPAPDAPEPSKNHQEPPKPRAPTFDEFWSSWPLAKTGKQKAAVAFKRLSAENRIAATRHAKAWARLWRQKYPTASDLHPATYLNGKRWEDEFEAKGWRSPVQPRGWSPGADIPSQAVPPLTPPTEDMTKWRTQ